MIRSIFLRISILSALLVLSLTVRSQENLPYADSRPFHFGFSLGMNSLDFGITESNMPIDGKIYSVGVSQLQPGFSVGIISDLRLTRYLNLRFTPTLHLGSRELHYTSDNNLTSTAVSISSTPVAFPVYLKYSAERRRNYRPYLIWGNGVSIDLAADPTKPILLRPFSFYTEFGAGCDIYFSFFKLAPELKFALGFNDQLTPLSERTDAELSANSKVFSNALSRLTTKMISLSFNFE